MLISRNWLQSYFEIELPDVQTIADRLLLHSFEIEEIKKIGDDDVIEIDVLPNRAHDCLCHMGLAKELSVLLDLPLKDYTCEGEGNLGSSELKVRIDSDQCTRYIGTKVSDVVIEDSPQWIRERLAAMGQKSINNLVDITNYVMFDIGQPMHVFDADKVSGSITIRNAHANEVMTTLSGDNIDLLETDLLITDDEGILALAGVKGGTKAEVTADTKNIIIEAAHFQSTSTRLTARRVKILTDASKRYENGITAQKAELANSLMISLMKNIMPGDMTFHESVDVYPNPETEYRLVFTRSHTAGLLGLEIGLVEIEEIIGRMGYAFTRKDEEFTVTVPADRLDLRIAEDMIEEIGRIYGYHNIPTKSVDEFEFTPRIHAVTHAIHSLRNSLVNLGFTELMTYSFVKKGDLEVFNPIASDKKALRKTIWKQIDTAVEKNVRNADYFGMNQIKVFEIGRVYTANGEHLQCVVHIHNVNKKARKQFGPEAEQLQSVVSRLNLDVETFIEGNNLVINLNEVIGADSYGDVFCSRSFEDGAQFITISPYQFMTRDVSLWVPAGVDEAAVRNTIADANPNFLKKVFLFDQFEKDGRMSLAFSLVFQSDTRTLTDEELELEMEKVYKHIESLGGEIR